MQALKPARASTTRSRLPQSAKTRKQLLATAKTTGLRVGGAPDTFLGGGLQTCRKLIDDGAIGEPVGATAFMMLSRARKLASRTRSSSTKPGGGPMFDMGPYYLTALVCLLGPVSARDRLDRDHLPERTHHQRAASTAQKIAVEMPTHVAGVLDFASGAVGTIITSFDVWPHSCRASRSTAPKARCSVPDPNTFGGPVQLLRKLARRSGATCR